MADMKIKAAAIEQELWFPNIKAYNKYIDKLLKKGVQFEVLSEKPGPNNGVTVFLRRDHVPCVKYLPKLKGVWERNDHGETVCSVCGYKALENADGFSLLTRYCPFCSADLRKHKFSKNVSDNF